MKRVALTLLLVVVAFVASPTVGMITPRVQAAEAAPPVVVPCQAINTAKVSDSFVIVVFRCEPENGLPYLLNSVGFMKDVEP